MRSARKQSPADIYHVISRGTGKQLIFEDDGDRRYFLATLADCLNRTGCQLYAWCLMGNHFHLLVHAPLEQVSSMMRYLCGGYAQWFNQKTGRVGHLFQERYKSEPVDTDAYLRTVIRYIHYNPVKAGLAQVESYKWSSYSEYLGKQGLCDVAFPLDAFGGIEQFTSFHDAHATGEEIKDQCLDVDLPRNATRSMPDDQACALAKEALGCVSLSELKGLDINLRRQSLRILKDRGLSVRQIERLTGIGRGAINVA